MKENVINYIKKHWLGLALILSGLFVIGWGFSVRPVVIDESSNQAQTTQQSNISTEILELHQQIESLQNQVSSLESQIKIIDSLRLDNARHTPDKSVRDHYRDLSKRYANDRRIK